MDDLNSAVAAILEIYSGGITALKKLRKTRKEKKTQLDPATKSAESRLGKSLKQSQSNIKTAYEKDVENLGPRFRSGDAKTRSVLVKILNRLRIAFEAMKEKLYRGRSSREDYHALMALSNSSRLETIRAFAELSSRLSKSSAQIVPLIEQITVPDTRIAIRNQAVEHIPKPEKKRGHHSKKGQGLAIELSTFTTVGTQGFEKPKTKKRASSSSTKTPNSSKLSSTKPKKEPKVKEKLLSEEKASDTLPGCFQSPAVEARRSDRTSILSFVTDSTKLGEIPQHKWAPQLNKAGEQVVYPILAMYPLEPYKPPSKPRSKLQKLFRR